MLRFNSHGYLIPDQSITSTVDELHQEFVLNYSSVERSQLYDSYLRYSEDLKQVCGLDVIVQWIDGSFVSHAKPRPGDIDMVCFIDEMVIAKLGDALNPFVYPQSRLNYPGIDAYIISKSSSDSSFYSFYLSDQKYWISQFSRTRRNRSGNKLPKGFLEINY